MYSPEHNDHPCTYEKNIFKTVLHIATEGMFIYRDKLYQQIDGVAMGSPLGPTIANFFLAHMEKTIFQQQMSNHPKLHLRSLMTALLFLMTTMLARLF